MLLMNAAEYVDDDDDYTLGRGHGDCGVSTPLLFTRAIPIGLAKIYERNLPPTYFPKYTKSSAVRMH